MMAVLSSPITAILHLTWFRMEVPRRTRKTRPPATFCEFCMAPNFEPNNKPNGGDLVIGKFGIWGFRTLHWKEQIGLAWDSKKYKIVHSLVRSEMQESDIYEEPNPMHVFSKVNSIRVNGTYSHKKVMMGLYIPNMCTGLILSISQSLQVAQYSW